LNGLGALRKTPATKLCDGSLKAIAAQDAGHCLKPLYITAPRFTETICAGNIVKVLVEIVKGIVGGILNQTGTDAWLRESLPVNEASELCS
jgi:hypothetical protein